MTVSIGFRIGVSAFTATGAGAPPVPPAPAVTGIAADGWHAIHPAPPAFTPHTAPETLSITRQGFDAAGAPQAVAETLTLMKRQREAYPDQAQLTADRVILSDAVYAGDTVAGVTNASTLAAPRPVCMWLRPDWEIAYGGTHTVRLAVAHLHARAGRPVAAVTFSATDGSTTVTQTVSAMTTITYAASGLTVPHFAAALDLSGLDDDAGIEIDATVYPWVGAAFTLSADGAAYPSISCAPLNVIKAGPGYAPVYAHVDSGTGSDGTGVASATAATAAAAPFATVTAAVTAIRAFNNANRGRNDPGGGIIRLGDGTHAIGSFRSAAGFAMVGPMVIEGASRAGTIATDTGSTTTSSAAQRVHFRNLTMRRSNTGNVTWLDNNAGAANTQTMVFEEVTFDEGPATGFYPAWLWKTARFWAIECDCTAAYGPFNVSGTANKVGNFIGCGAKVRGNAGYNVAGCQGGGYSGNSQGSGDREAASGLFLGFNAFSADDAANPVVQISQTVGAAGLALVGSVIEDIDGTTSPALWINADGNSSPSQNVVLTMNTVVGQRTNFLYNDTGAAAKSGTCRFNVFRSFNTKTDIFAADGTRVGNWPAANHLGFRANAYLLGGDDGSTGFAAGNWVGETGGLGEVIGAVPDWLDDASAAGSGLGGGDYTPGPGAVLPTVPAGLAPYPVDQKGRAIANDGSALAGALQRT